MKFGVVLAMFFLSKITTALFAPNPSTISKNNVVLVP